MIKLTLILLSSLSINLTTSSAKMYSEINGDIVEIHFSEKVIGIESGQPVYPTNTKVWLTSNDKNIKEIKLLVNEREEVLENEEKIDLSAITQLESGTYTLVVKAGQERTFGFTIQ